MWFRILQDSSIVCILYMFAWIYVSSIYFQEKKRNNLNDFWKVAGQMGVTHYLMLSKTDSAPYLRVAHAPHGPTLSFKIHEYSLAADVAQSQLRPRCPPDLFKTPPLVIFPVDTQLIILHLLTCTCTQEYILNLLNMQKHIIHLEANP